MLLVSTDPASNVGQVFGITIGNHITPVPDVPGLIGAGNRSAGCRPGATATASSDRCAAYRCGGEGIEGAALRRLHDRDCRLR